MYGYELELMNDNRSVVRSVMPMTRTEASEALKRAITYYTVTHPWARIISATIIERK